MRRRKSRIPIEKQWRLIACFVDGQSARSVATACHLYRDPVVNYFAKIREKLATEMDSRFERLEHRWPEGVVRSLDVGNPPRSKIVGTEGEVPLFGIKATREGVLTVGFQEGVRREIQKAASGLLDDEIKKLTLARNRSRSLKQKEKIYKSICKLKKNAYRKYHLYSEIFCVSSLRCVAMNNDFEIGSFLQYVRQRMSIYRGVPTRDFHLFLKECEYLFNASPDWAEVANLMGVAPGEVKELFSVGCPLSRRGRRGPASARRSPNRRFRGIPR